MTDEEKADKWVKHNCCEVCVNKEECDLGYINCFAKLAYLAGRPKWHKVADGDLPDCERVVLNQKGMVTLYNPYTGFDEIGVIAWCEIPKYTEE